MFKSTSTKISLALIIVTTALLSLVNVVTIVKTEREFRSFLNKRQVIRIINVRPQPAALELERNFRKNLYSTIFFANIIGLGTAIIVGILLSNNITKPLKSLLEGITHLKENKYKFRIEKTGSEDFDEVIEEFNKLVKEIGRVEELRRDLVADVSHELKTPVTSLLGQIQGLEDGVMELDQKRLKKIKKQILRLNGLIQQLQDNTQLRAKIVNLDVDKFKLKNFIKSVFDDFSEVIERQNVHVKIEIENDLEIRADQDLLYRVIYNLVENSLKYSKGNLIQVKANSKELIFRDNGVGVPESDLDKIFERFYRLEKSRNRKTGGLGLGLSIVKEIIEAHGWEVEAGNNEGLEMVIKFG